MRIRVDAQPSAAHGVRRYPVVAVVLIVVLVGGSVAGALAAAAPRRGVIVGLDDAGALTQSLTVIAQACSTVLAAVTIGGLLAAAALIPCGAGGELTADGRRTLRVTSWCGAAWAAASLCLAVLSAADTMGVPVGEVLNSDDPLRALGLVALPRAAAIAAVIATLIAVTVRFVRRVPWAFAMLCLALGALVPAALAGHAAQTQDHDLAVDGMLYHQFGAALWVGGLVTLVYLMGGRAERIDVIARRYSTLALIAMIAVAGSGVVGAVVRVPQWADLTGTVYGRLIVAKSLAVILLGVIGYLHRRFTLPQIRRKGDSGPLTRLAVVEVLLMAATMGLAATLSFTAAPTGSKPLASASARVLGYQLPGPVSPRNLLLFWRPDLILGVGAVVLAACYVVGLVRLLRRGEAWPAGRAVSWLIGCAVLLWASSSAMGSFGRAMFSMHMISHLLIGMLVPILLVLGRPLTLLEQALPAARDGEPPGLREAVTGLARSRVLRIVMHPLIIVPLFALLSFYALYFTDLFDLAMSSHPGHLLMNISFLLIGYLYYWVVIGADTGPAEHSVLVRLAIVFLTTPMHMLWGIIVMGSHGLLAGAYFRGLDLPWVPDPLSDQRVGGAIGWVFSEVPLVIVMLALAAQWFRSEQRPYDDTDVPAPEDEAERIAYNAMLAALNRRPQD